MRTKNKANRIGGLKAKRNGSRFELTLKTQALTQEWEVIQIPSGCRFVSHFKAIPVKTPFDFVFVRNFQRTIFCDAKTTQLKTFGRALIKEHQVSKLMEMHNRGFAAGYIVNFASIDQTIFFDAKTLKDCLLGDGTGLKPIQGKLLGTNSKIDLMILISDITQEIVTGR